MVASIMILRREHDSMLKSLSFDGFGGLGREQMGRKKSFHSGLNMYIAITIGYPFLDFTVLPQHKGF